MNLKIKCITRKVEAQLTSIFDADCQRVNKDKIIIIEVLAGQVFFLALHKMLRIVHYYYSI